MKLFLDTGSVDEVRDIAAWGVLAGVTTNPTLLAKSANDDPGAALKAICELIGEGKSVSVEAVGESCEEMVYEGEAFYALSESNITVKIPFSQVGLQATSKLREKGIPVNMTLVFSPTQALLAARAGATYISCFMGRLDDISVDASGVLQEILDCLCAEDLRAQVLAASIRHPQHVVTAAKVGCDIATVPASVFHQMLNHPLTTSGIERFQADWNSEPVLEQWRQTTLRR